MMIAEISVIPLGTKTPSVSKYVASTLKILQNSGLKYSITPMSTVLEGTLDEVLEVAKKMHQSVFESGALRVVTTLKIDDRRDKEISMQYKVDAVKKNNIS